MYGSSSAKNTVKYHVLRHLLIPVHDTSHSYSLGPRAHDRELPDRLTHLTDCNFIIRMLFYQVYWHYFLLYIYIFVLVIVFTAFWQWINKRICYVTLCYVKYLYLCHLLSLLLSSWLNWRYHRPGCCSGPDISLRTRSVSVRWHRYILYQSLVRASLSSANTFALPLWYVL